MNKLSLLLSCCLLGHGTEVLAASNNIVKVSPPASMASGVEISIFGLGPPVDGKAVQEVQRLIGQAVGSAVVDRYLVRRYGIEGGFSACAQKSPFALQQRFAAFMARLNAVESNMATTAYQIKAVISCDDSVTCATDVKTCSDGATVPRVPPRCEFTPCSYRNEIP